MDSGQRFRFLPGRYVLLYIQVPLQHPEKLINLAMVERVDRLFRTL